jgi:hypothetical protein
MSKSLQCEGFADVPCSVVVQPVPYRLRPDRACARSRCQGGRRLSPLQHRTARFRREEPRAPAYHAGGRFTGEQLEITFEEKELVIRGRQQEDKGRQFLHRGIAARQFQRTFVLADGMEVQGADLKNGLLSIDLVRPEPARVIKTVNIAVHE